MSMNLSSSKDVQRRAAGPPKIPHNFKKGTQLHDTPVPDINIWLSSANFIIQCSLCFMECL